MGNRLKNLGLVGLGLVAGIAGSMQFDALAQRNAGTPLPVEELRQLADVFGLIKSDYVEPVEDKKLLTEAISGMVSSLDPHSAFLDSCAHHTREWGDIVIAGDNQAAALANWYAWLDDRTGKAKPVWRQGLPYPCAACCNASSAAGWGAKREH